VLAFLPVPTLCYVYGLLNPIVGEPLVDQQVAAAHRYRNALTEIERDRRAAAREALSSHASVADDEARLVELVRQRDQARDAIRLQRKATRSRSEVDTARAAVRELGAQVKALRAQLREAKTALREDATVAAALVEIEARAQARVREARAACGVYWGTYLLVEDDAQRARKAPTPPDFVRWHASGRWRFRRTDDAPAWLADGRVSVQIQGGMPAEAMFGVDSRVRVDRVSLAAWAPETPRGERRRLARTTLRLRVGSDERRQPIWAEWPMIMHRPLPEGAIIKRVTVARRARDSVTWRWTAEFTIEIPEATVLRRRPAAGVCAINLGWRLFDDRLRIGYVVADDGHREEITLPPDIIPRLRKVEDLRAIRDKHLNAMQPRLVEWLGAYAGLPQWLVERAAYVGQWRSHDRFRGLAYEWRRRRFDGDAVGYGLIEAWRYRDEHLERYESGVRNGALGHRRDAYRVIAARLATRYRALVIDTTDYRDFQRSPAPESDRVEIAAAKWQQRAAAPSLLRTALVNAFSNHVVSVAPDKLTITCHACGHVDAAWDRRAHVEHTCVSCNARWDQDVNAALNCLQRGRERLAAAPDAVGARAVNVTESAWVRRKREAKTRRIVVTGDTARK
jgi:hypothetical protein